MNITDEIFDVAALAKYLGVHPSTIYRALRDKQIPGFKIGSDHRFRKTSIDKWIEQQEAKESKE